MNINADKIKADIKKAWEENTAICLLAGATALSGVAKLMNARTSQKNSKVHRKEVNRRIKNDALRAKNK